jgi:Flp pilus assembly protein CpaB
MRPRPRPRRRHVGSRPRFRPGLVLRRDPRLWWVLVLAISLGAGSLAASIVGRAERTRLAWGATRQVLVARHDLAPGDELHHRDVVLTERPAATVPATALHALPDRARVRAGVLAGEVVVAARVAPTGLRGVAARVPSGMRAVAIPTEPGTAPPLLLGDRVDVLVALPPDSAGAGPPGFAIATDAVVVAIDEAAVTVAVRRDAAPRIAVALGQGAVTLALIGR